MNTNKHFAAGPPPDVKIPRGPTAGERVSVLLSAPFRPFFIAAVLQALMVIAAGPLVTAITSADAAAAWHAHELLFGYVPAVQAGILLTAVATWTGRRLIAGAPIVALLVLWLAGRLTIAVAGIGPAEAATVAIAFPAGLALLLGYEIIAGRNFTNLPMVVVLVALSVAQALFHWEVAETGRSVFGERLAIAAIMAQFMVLLGRFVPMFTRDFLTPAGSGPMPATFGRVDAIALALGLAALAAWIGLPALGAWQAPAGVLLLTAGLAHVVRQSRWAPQRTLAEPLLCVLHAGYGALPLGLLVAGAAVITDAQRLAFATIHVWAIGGTALMTFALMTRASLGHTGRPLQALPGTSVLYGAIAAALVFRVAGVLAPHWAFALTPAAGLFWMAAFGGFLLIYGSLLLRPEIGKAHTG